MGNFRQWLLRNLKEADGINSDDPDKTLPPDASFCIKCHRMGKSSDPKCRYCGAPKSVAPKNTSTFTPAPAPTKSSMPRRTYIEPEEDQTIGPDVSRCPRCNTLGSLSDPKCRNCGAVKNSSSKQVQCKSCGIEGPSSSLTCPTCGAGGKARYG